jgi:PHP family Zn ribbon phosphoesterase
VEPENMDFVDRRIVDAITAFREEKVILHPGGGGKYGWIEMPEEKKDEGNDNKKSQSSLFDF